MLTIDINSNYFALGSSFSIRISNINPACFTDKIKSEAGLGINIPVNDINRGILGAPERFSKYFPEGNPGVKFPGCTIRFAGAHLLSGSLVVINATSEDYDCWLQSNLGVMGEELQNKTLQDMPWPTNQQFVAKNDYNDATDDYCTMIIKNPGFWDGKGRESDSVPIQYIDENGDPKIKLETRSVLSGDHYANYAWFVNQQLEEPEINKAGCVISPFLYLRYVIRHSLFMNGWFIRRNDMVSNPKLPAFPTAPCGQLAIYNNVSIVEPTFVTQPSTIPTWNYETNEIENKDENIITEQQW